jgi:hypothetical protein
MKILYNQSQLNRILILGIVFILLGVISLFFSTKTYLSGMAGIGLMHIIIYYYQKNRAYVTIKNDIISKDGVFIKHKIEVKKIISVKYFAGDYIIRSSDKELTIDTNLIDKESLPLLKSYFADLINP